MKYFYKFVFTILLTCTLSLISLILLSRVFNPKWVDHDGNMMTFIMKGFYKEKDDSIEVLFTGNSDVYRGVSPMVLYNKYGVTSYNFVSAGQRSWIAYRMLEEALEYQHPKVVLFNVDEMYSTNQPSIGNYSKVYDNMRIGKAKVNAIMDDAYEFGILRKLSHFLPILSYHDRYNEISSSDFKYVFYDYNNPTKGMDLIAKSIAYTGDYDYMNYTEEVEEAPESNLEYLDKMIELCDENNVELVLFEVPSPDSWNRAKHNFFDNYANSNDLKFIDLNMYIDEIGIDWEYDTSDGGDHLNVFGAEKVTDYLSDWLNENYELTDVRNNKDYKIWDEQYNEYLKIKEKEIQLAENENSY